MREGYVGDRCFFVVPGRVDYTIGDGEGSTAVGGAGALAWVAMVLVIALAAGAAVADMRRLERRRSRLT